MLLKERLSNQNAIIEFTAQIINGYKSNNQNESIYSIMIVARPTDNNYNSNLFDRIIKAFHIYSDADEAETIDAYDMRDKFMAENIDIIFWYSDSILTSTSRLYQIAKENKKNYYLYVSFLT